MPAPTVPAKSSRVVRPATPSRTQPRAERVYLYIDEATDDPHRWNDEAGYFGQVPAATAQQPAATPWYAAPLSFAMQLYQQRQMAKVQSERARAGLPPLSPEQYRAQYQPPIATAEIGLTPQTRNLLMIGGLALAALLLPALLKR